MQQYKTRNYAHNLRNLHVSNKSDKLLPMKLIMKIDNKHTYTNMLAINLRVIDCLIHSINYDKDT